MSIKNIACSRIRNKNFWEAKPTTLHSKSIFKLVLEKSTSLLVYFTHCKRKCQENINILEVAYFWTIKKHELFSVSFLSQWKSGSHKHESEEAISCSGLHRGLNPLEPKRMLWLAGYQTYFYLWDVRSAGNREVYKECNNFCQLLTMIDSNGSHLSVFVVCCYTCKFWQKPYAF